MRELRTFTSVDKSMNGPHQRCLSTSTGFKLYLMVEGLGSP
jgi:hypothetical protein